MLKTNSNHDFPQDTRHCVLIDGDFGRHELFSNIHPYTLDQIDKINKDFVFKDHARLAMELMNNERAVHYHIFYNAISKEVDDYYKILKLIYPLSIWLHPSFNSPIDLNNSNQINQNFMTATYGHKCEHLWIIHGVENHYEEFIRQANLHYNGAVIISSFYWLENLRNGSNRIEYFVHNKIKDLSTQSESRTLIMTTLELNPKTKISAERIACNFGSCNKTFQTEAGLRSHQMAKHSTNMSSIQKETIMTAKKLKKRENIPENLIICTAEDLKEVVTVNASEVHQSVKHLVTQHDSREEAATIELNDNEKKQDSNTIYGVKNWKEEFDNASALKDHQVANDLITQSVWQGQASATTVKPKEQKKRAETTVLICGIDGCKKTCQSIYALTTHRSVKHPGTQTLPNEETTMILIPKVNEKKSEPTQTLLCNFEGCKITFQSEDSLRSHQLTNHPTTQQTSNEDNRTTATIVLNDYHNVSQSNEECDVENFKEDFESENILINTSKLHGGKIKAKKAKKKIICPVEGCERKFKNQKALESHQLDKHLNTQRILQGNTRATASKQNVRKTQEIEEEQTVACTFDECKLIFDSTHVLEKHLIETHPIELRCPFTEKCLYPNESYLGKTNLLSHIMWQHPEPFSQYSCPVASCKHEKQPTDWLTVLNHIIRKHTRLLLNDTFTCINQQQSTISEINSSSDSDDAASAINMPIWELDDPLACLYGDCGRTYRTEEAIRRHQAFEHPVPLLCPFRSECRQLRRQFFGLNHLRTHIYSRHARTYSQPTCCDPECTYQEKKPFQSWNAVLRHILQIHMEYVGIVFESPVSNHLLFKKCCYNDCNKCFQTREKFQCHLVKHHRFPLRCPYESNVDKHVHNSVVYLGLIELEKHVKTEHSQQFRTPICCKVSCQNAQNYQDWNQVMNHILEKHWRDIRVKDDTIFSHT